MLFATLFVNDIFHTQILKRICAPLSPFTKEFQQHCYKITKILAMH